MVWWAIYCPPNHHYRLGKVALPTRLHKLRPVIQNVVKNDGAYVKSAIYTTICLFTKVAKRIAASTILPNGIYP